jgi:predicted choloylglycine hydrolase
MYMYRLEGTHRQIGAEYGMLLRSARVRLPRTSHTRLAFAEKCEPHVREHAPHLLDEIAGLAEGSGYDLARVRMAALAMDAHPACSVVAVSGDHTADGKPLFGRNFDWYHGLLHHTAFCHALPDGAIPSLGFNDVLVGRMGGVNTAGVAIAMASVEGGRDHPGVMFNLAVRAVLDRCASTAEAVGFLRTIRHARTVNFLVADRSGEIAIVEASPYHVASIRPTNGFAAITNQFQSDEMARYEKTRRRPANSYRRLCTLREWFAARRGPITPDDLQRILSTPHPHGVCWTSAGRRKGVRTIWSWTARPGANVIALAQGSPVEVAYRTYTF